MTNLSSIRCDKCARYVEPILTPGEDFTVVTCPTCQADLTYSWYLSQQASGPLKLIGWTVIVILVLVLVHACTTAFG